MGRPILCLTLVVAMILFFKFNVRLYPAAGPTTEVTTTTLMNCSLDQAVKLLGPKFQTQGPVDPGQPRCV
ncbi:hypothetical protein PF005_g14579 [Phytophthora fragariae]|uniref:Uncharacterized protein n=2 Tax=Phytophthora TaxID=4783 RepID=A0A6A3XS51_9STRA|nr:hypothetical protein PF003_g10884 [Phytophthora fragariae]KAE9015397.1 hypothetical protein PR002_g13937 [Phytophthora rubi]KAE8943072.1 hypothetical protein PF009_g7186 [Phytophthora fragariae]KAE8997882.1 hypothetical protein PF011_g15287 [Phytophthora fragariae]KAE9020696.1 hypothetical protein PR001_g13536 [Phytophthora rubi]